MLPCQNCPALPRLHLVLAVRDILALEIGPIYFLFPTIAKTLLFLINIHIPPHPTNHTVAVQSLFQYPGRDLEGHQCLSGLIGTVWGTTTLFVSCLSHAVVFPLLPWPTVCWRQRCRRQRIRTRGPTISKWQIQLSLIYCNLCKEVWIVAYNYWNVQYIMLGIPDLYYQCFFVSINSYIGLHLVSKSGSHNCNHKVL